MSNPPHAETAVFACRPGRPEQRLGLVEGTSATGAHGQVSLKFVAANGRFVAFETDTSAGASVGVEDVELGRRVSVDASAGPSRPLDVSRQGVEELRAITLRHDGTVAWISASGERADHFQIWAGRKDRVTQVGDVIGGPAPDGLHLGATTVSWAQGATGYQARPASILAPVVPEPALPRGCTPRAAGRVRASSGRTRVFVLRREHGSRGVYACRPGRPPVRLGNTPGTFVDSHYHEDEVDPSAVVANGRFVAFERDSGQEGDRTPFPDGAYLLVVVDVQTGRTVTTTGTGYVPQPTPTYQGIGPIHVLKLRGDGAVAWIASGDGRSEVWAGRGRVFTRLAASDDGPPPSRLDFGATTVSWSQGDQRFSATPASVRSGNPMASSTG